MPLPENPKDGKRPRSRQQDLANKQLVRLASDLHTSARLQATEVRGSGCGRYQKGDFVVEDFLLELKNTTKGSFRVSIEDLAKINHDAQENGQEPAFCIDFENAPQRIQSWVMVRRDVLLELLRRIPTSS